MAIIYWNSTDCSAISDEELFMLEWSTSGKQFHIDNCVRLLGLNYQSRENHKDLDYIPVAIGTDRKELANLALWIEKSHPQWLEEQKRSVFGYDRRKSREVM